MGRIFRLIKVVFFLSSITTGVMMFNAFSGAPEVDVTVGESLKQQIFDSIENGLEKGKTLTQEILLGAEPTDSKARTEWFHKNVEKQKRNDTAANQRNENSYMYHHNGKKWVFIQGKYYQYNPKNIYQINGVRTFYKPPQSKAEESRVAAASGSQQSIHSTKVVSQAQPLDSKISVSSVYSRKGMAQLKQNLNNIKVQMKKRNEVLQSLQNDDAGRRSVH